jgi:type I restriction enzyme, R subunit
VSVNESNTVEAFIRDQLCGSITHHTAVGPCLAPRNRQVSGLNWHYLNTTTLSRQPQEVLVEDHLRDALIRPNPSITAQPDRVDDVLYRLRAIVMTVRDSGVVKAGENLAESSLDVPNSGVFE